MLFYLELKQELEPPPFCKLPQTTHMCVWLLSSNSKDPKATLYWLTVAQGTLPRSTCCFRPLQPPTSIGTQNTSVLRRRPHPATPNAGRKSPSHRVLRATTPRGPGRRIENQGPEFQLPQKPIKLTPRFLRTGKGLTK